MDNENTHFPQPSGKVSKSLMDYGTSSAFWVPEALGAEVRRQCRQLQEYPYVFMVKGGVCRGAVLFEVVGQLQEVFWAWFTSHIHPNRHTHWHII